MRLSGIASGFDTDTMVQEMMKVERMKVNKYEQNKQIALWRQESYNSMNKLFANFILNTKKDIGLKHTNSTGSIFDSSYKSLSYVKRATSSNESAATVTTTNKAVNGSYKIDVEQLAEGASFTSANISDETFKDKTELEFTLGTGQKDIGGKEITKKIVVKNASGITMDDVTKAINEESLGVTAFYDKSNGRLFMQTTHTGEGVKIDITGNDEFASRLGYAKGASFTSTKITDETFKDIKKMKFTINGKDIVVEDGTADITIGDIVEKINESVPEVKAFYDEKNGRLSIHASEGAKIEIIGDGQFEAKLGYPEVEDGNSSKYSGGQNAIVKYNGVPLNNYSSNKINLNGLDIELKSKGITTINVKTNTDGIIEKIEKLVADYNELIDTASKLVGEKKYSQYKPLSPEERKSMSEEDLKLWDEKSKSGMLNGDETIQRTLQAMRTNLYKTVEGLEGKFKHITEIGISTEKYSKGAAGGKLQIDTDKLRQAIEEDPEGVMELLFKDDGGDSTDPTKTTNGLFTNVYDDIIGGMKAIIDKSGPGEDSELFRGVKSNMLIDFVTKKGSISDLDKSVMEMNKQIDNLTVLLAKKEDSYYAKFTAMEKYMYQMNGQSGWLAQQFG